LGVTKRQGLKCSTLYIDTIFDFDMLSISNRVFGWGLGGLGWIQPSFGERSQPAQCLVTLLFLGTDPTYFSVWLKNWGQSGSIQRLVEGI